MLSGFNSATLIASSIKGYIMATKAKTKAGRVAERKTSRSQTPNRKKEAQPASPSAIDLLEEDHRQVEEWFDEYDELKEDDDRKAELAQKICLALKVHAQIEEEIFYPQAREATKDNDLIDEAVVEHATVKNLIAEIESMEVGEDLYDAKISGSRRNGKAAHQGRGRRAFPGTRTHQNGSRGVRQGTCGAQARAYVGNASLNETLAQTRAMALPSGGAFGC